MMASKSIKRMDLWKSLGSVRFKDWQNAASKLGLPVTRPDSGSSHQTIRKKTNPIDYTLGGVIANIYPKMFKQVNEKVFKELLKYGIEEDNIWRALGKL